MRKHNSMITKNQRNRNLQSEYIKSNKNRKEIDWNKRIKT